MIKTYITQYRLWYKKRLHLAVSVLPQHRNTISGSGSPHQRNIKSEWCSEVTKEYTKWGKATATAPRYNVDRATRPPNIKRLGPWTRPAWSEPCWTQWTDLNARARRIFAKLTKLSWPDRGSTSTAGTGGPPSSPPPQGQTGPLMTA